MKYKNLLKDIPVIVLGNLIIAIAINYIIIPNQVLVGGTAGVAVAFNVLLGIDENLFINIFTISMFILGAIMLGKEFAAKTVISTILLPLFLQLTLYITRDIPIETFQTNWIVATIYGGVIQGIGVGLVFRKGASTGGMDVPPLIASKYSRVSVSKLVLVFDGITVLFGAVALGMEASLQGIFGVIAGSLAINYMMTVGGSHAKKVMIISDDYEIILAKIDEDLARGSTLLHGEGGFSRTDKPVIMTVISQKQYPMLIDIVRGIDEKAFVVVSDAYEVHGLGFSYLEEL